MAHNVAAVVRLMLVTDDRLVAGRDLVAAARAAERGGVTSVQLRLKHSSARQQVSLARALVAALTSPVLVNDRLDVALAAGAAGVHLGPDDLPPALARRVTPAGFLIGASAGSEAECIAAAGADYWGIGPLHATATKADAGGALGISGFKRVTRAGGDRPFVAIGGIQPQDVPAVITAGGAGVAVASGILARDDIEAAAREYAQAFPG